jgi:hypothetical protein
VFATVIHLHPSLIAPYEAKSLPLGWSAERVSTLVGSGGRKFWNDFRKRFVNASLVFDVVTQKKKVLNHFYSMVLTDFEKKLNQNNL